MMKGEGGAKNTERGQEEGRQGTEGNRSALGPPVMLVYMALHLVIHPSICPFASQSDISPSFILHPSAVQPPFFFLLPAAKFSYTSAGARLHPNMLYQS